MTTTTLESRAKVDHSLDEPYDTDFIAGDDNDAEDTLSSMDCSYYMGEKMTAQLHRQFLQIGLLGSRMGCQERELCFRLGDSHRDIYSPRMLAERILRETNFTPDRYNQICYRCHGGHPGSVLSGQLFRGEALRSSYF